MPEKTARAKASKMANEDARFVIAQRLRDKNGNDHELPQPEQLFQPARCNRAQWEIRAVADEMLRLVYPLAPHVFAAAGPAAWRVPARRAVCAAASRTPCVINMQH